MARGTIVTRLQKDGTKRYAAVIRINGKQRWQTFDKKKEAEDWLDRHSTDIRDGSYREIKKGSFAQYSDHWKQTHVIAESMKPSTLNSYLSVFEKHIRPEFEHMNMQAVSAAEINAFKAKLQKKGLAKKTVRNILNLVNLFFVHAVKDGYVRHSPMEGVDKPEISRKRKGRALRAEEIQALLANCETTDTRLIVLTAILTGMRRGELFGLRWEDIDWQHNVIHVRQALYWRYGKHIRPAEGELFAFIDPKSDSSIREIDLSPTLKVELTARRDQKSMITVSASGEMSVKEPTGLVFCTTEGRPLDPDAFQKKQFTNAVIAAQIGSLRFHDLRHTFGSLKLEQGENIYYVQRQMGHSSIQVTIDIYGHLLETRKPDAAKKTDALIFGKSAEKG
jgi:integrase